ncbi:LacI family transcriptional regulator [Nakamurella sp. UYEF19]|uniref:LacI family DNA-binding transcriptional regulator n=1 Tax=Nakamurella sp. UYEF19 TaxID=1756392 RepID=UPI003392373A
MAPPEAGSTGPIKISDVALAAGVSAATVSKALNGRSDVSAATRERVLAIAARLQFRPNAMAGSLRTGRSFSVGLLTTDSFGRFSIPVMLGAEDALGSGEVAIIFCDTRDDPEREARQLEALLHRQVDGIIVNGRRTEARPPLIGTRGLPVVYAFSPSQDPADCSVIADEPNGARLAVEHLLTGGRKRIAHVTGPRRHRSAAIRATTTTARLRRAGLRVDGGVRFGAWTEEWGRQAVADLLRDSPDLDAVFCGSDQIARGVMDGLREAGRSVPDDVAVVGFDNWEVMATATRPPLTTVDMNIDVIGRIAAQLLLGAIDRSPTSGTTVVPARLVVRQSS